MRSALLSAVIAKHLGPLEQHRANLAAILEGRAAILVPTIAEQARFEDELRETELAEAALGTLLPAIWTVPATSSIAPKLVAEARVLVRIRAAAATLALALQQPEVPQSAEAGRQRAQAVALFRYAERALLRFQFDDRDDLPGKSAQYDRIVAYAIFGQRWGSF